MKYGDLVVTAAKRIRSSHMVTDSVNGGVRTSCGMFLAAGKHREAPESVRPCGKCASHLAENPTRKRFVNNVYPYSPTANRALTT